MSLYQQRVAQTGKPELVLLHGWGMNAEVWQPVLEPLSRHFSLTLFDLPGLGRSSERPQSYSFEAVAERLLQDAPEQAHWLGWSLGGTVATAAAVKAPERVLSLTTVASNPCFVQRDDWSNAMTDEVFTGFQLALQENAAKTLSRFIMLQTQGGSAAREILRTLKGLLKVGEPSALAESLALLAEDQRSMLADVQCPLLTVWGEQDQLVPVATADLLKALKPEQQSLVVAGAGHLPFLSDTEQFVKTLCDFIGAKA